MKSKLLFQILLFSAVIRNTTSLAQVFALEEKVFLSPKILKQNKVSSVVAFYNYRDTTIHKLHGFISKSELDSNGILSRLTYITREITENESKNEKYWGYCLRMDSFSSDPLTGNLICHHVKQSETFVHNLSNRFSNKNMIEIFNKLTTTFKYYQGTNEYDGTNFYYGILKDSAILDKKMSIPSEYYPQGDSIVYTSDTIKTYRREDSKMIEEFKYYFKERHVLVMEPYCEFDSEGRLYYDLFLGRFYIYDYNGLHIKTKINADEYVRFEYSKHR